MSWKRFPGACQPDAGQKFAGWPRVVRGDTADGVLREGRQYDPAFDKTYFLPACSLQVRASPPPLSVLSPPALLSPTQRSKQVGCPVEAQLLLACSPAWRSGHALALRGLSAAEDGRKGTASASEAGGIRACRAGQFPRRPICRVGRFPCRVGQFPVAQRGHSFADMRSPCRRTRARTWRRPPSSTSSPSPAPPPLPSPWRTGGAPRRVAHRLFRHEQELRHGGPARPAPATRHAGDGR